MARDAENAAERARRALSRRWPDVEVVIVDKAPVKRNPGRGQTSCGRCHRAWLARSWRGSSTAHGQCVSGGCRGAKSAVLVVRQPKRVGTIVLGYDGSATAQHAVAFVEKLEPPQDGRVTLVNSVQLTAIPSRGSVPGAAVIAGEIRRTNSMRSREAMRELSRATRQLKRSGWAHARDAHQR